MAKSSLDKMKERLKKSSPKISGRANLENMNQIRNFVFGKSKKMGAEDDVLGIATQKAKKKIADNKKKTSTTKGKVDVGLQKALKNKKKKSSGGGQGQSSGNIYLRTGRNQSTTYLGGKGDARTVKPYKFDKDGVKPIGGKNKKTDNKNKTGQAPTKKGKVKATAANTKDFASTMAMQKRLIAKGAKIKADGIMGAKTRAAMKKFMSKPTVPAKKKVMVDSFKKSNVSANKNKKAGIDAAKGDNKKAKTFKSSNPKLDSKGNYKGTNIKPTKLQLERMKKRRARASST
jgi:hypothetical protein